MNSTQGALGASQSETLQPAPSGRMMSLDALRGFDMFWIMGADEFVQSLRKIGHTGVVGFLGYELKHAEWEGFRFYDLVFPLFLFMVGISTVFSVGKLQECDGRWAAYRRILRRFVLLWLWAFVLDGGFAQPQVSFAGVLQRISYCYLVTSLLFCHLRLRGLATLCVTILAGYWALLTFVPVPELGHPTFEMHKNWANYLDRHYLPGNREARGWRNEGMLSTLPAICTCLLGAFAGLYLKNGSQAREKKAYWMVGVGSALVGLGFLWGIQLPIIKRIWTSSYVLVSGGYSCILLGLFYLVVDVWGYRRWSAPFVWIGANALAIYIIGNLIPYEPLTGRVIGGRVQACLAPYDAVARTALWMLLLTLFARFLYKRGILLRV